MNPQMNLLTKHNLLTPMLTLIQNALTTRPESSHELYLKIKDSFVLSQLRNILSSYPASGFKEPASFVGSLCAYAANQGAMIRSMKTCPISKTFNDAFKLS